MQGEPDWVIVEITAQTDRLAALGRVANGVAIIASSDSRGLVTARGGRSASQRDGGDPTRAGREPDREQRIRRTWGGTGAGPEAPALISDVPYEP